MARTHHRHQFPRPRRADTQFPAQRLRRQRPLMQLPVPNVNLPGARKEGITNSCTFADAWLRPRALGLIAGAVGKKLHREQKCHRRPPRHQDRLPRQGGRRGHVGCEGDSDPQRVCRSRIAPTCGQLCVGITAGQPACPSLRRRARGEPETRVLAVLRTADAPVGESGLAALKMRGAPDRAHDEPAG